MCIKLMLFLKQKEKLVRYVSAQILTTYKHKSFNIIYCTYKRKQSFCILFYTSLHILYPTTWHQYLISGRNE